MNFRILKLFFATVAVIAGISQVAVAQTLTITNGVQKYSSLTSTTVTMTGKCELWVTNSSTPISGCTINLNSIDAWLFLPGIKPSVVVSSYLSQMRINGTGAVADSNVRVVQYGQNGAIVIPHSSTFQPLSVFTEPQFNGTAKQYSQWTYYTGAANAHVSSFKLKRGYQVVFAQTADGKNNSKCYVAQDGDLEIGALPNTLDGQVQFIYVTPLRWTGKKGIAGNPGNSWLNLLWWYDWNIDQNSTRDLEYVAIRQQQFWPSLSQNWQSRGINTILGYNEPDQANQANLSVSTAISSWGDVLGTGLRVGSPATSDGGRSSWLYPFVSQADAAGLRVDFVAIHYYQSHNPADPSGCASQMLSFLQDVWNHTHRPIWVTEWNNGANWTDSQNPPPTYAQQQACVQAMVNMLETTPFVERYALYNWVEDTRSLVTSSNTVTPAGSFYSNVVSSLAYSQAMPDNGVHGIAQFLFSTNTWDSSGYCNNGMAVGAPGYTVGHNAQSQAIVLDGQSSYVQLPANIAQGSGFTFAGWINWNGGANWQRIFDFGNDTSHYLFLTPSSGSGTLRFAINNGGGEQTVETSALASGSWQHVAVTLNGSAATLYVNGVQVASSGSFSIAPSTFNPIKNYLGKSQFNADPLFNGMMDAVTIKDYAMSAGQIAQLQTNVPPQFTTNLLIRSGGTEAVPYSDTIAGTAVSSNPGDTLTYSKASGPAWLNVAADGTLSGTPTSGDGGTNYFTIAASDSAAQNAFVILAIPVTVFTTSGAWIADASDVWSQTNDWSGNAVANGVNETADFSTINITADRTVTLDSSRTIGFLKFSDTAGANNWTLAGANGSVLTLDTGSATAPLITVTNTAAISASVTGTNGFTKTGPGTLILSGNNPLTGTLFIDTGSNTGNDGTVRVTGPDAIDNVSLVSIRNNNSGNSTLQLDGSAGNITINANFTVTYRNNGVIAIENLSGTNVINGNFQLFQGGNSHTVQSDTGLIVFTGTNQYVGGITGVRTNYFTGPGDHLVVGPILDSTNGSPVALVKNGGGKLTLGGANTYTNGTALNGGTLLVDGVLPAPFSVASGTTLGGSGVINAPVTLPGSTTVIPGDNFGTLTINNNLSLNSGTQTIMQIAPAENLVPLTNAQLIVSGTFSPAGALVVTNLGGPLSVGESFQLFNATGIAGQFATMNFPPLDPSLVWSFNPVTGILMVAPASNTPPAISSIVDQTVNENSATGSIAFTVGDAETSADSLTVNGISSNAGLVPPSSIVFSGSGSNRTVTITPAANKSGTATITLAVSDGFTNATTSFLLTVNFIDQPPTISAIPNQTWNKNVAIGPLSFTVGDPDNAASSLNVSASSSNPALIPLSGIVFGGSGSNRTVTLNPATNQGGTSTITLTVSDGTLSTNTAFLVTVIAPTTISKANNTDNLNLGSSWVGGAVPDANGIGLWNSTVTSANTVALGGNPTWNGLKVQNPGGSVAIAAGNTLTLGVSGIDLSGATQNLTISSGLTISAGNQAWNVAGGQSLTLNTGTFSRNTGSSLNVQGAGTLAANMPGLTVDASRPSGVLGGWIFVNNTNFATITGGNVIPYTGGFASTTWGFTDGTGSTNYNVTAASGTTYGASSRVVNTVRYTGAADTLTLGNNNSGSQLVANGVINAGTGTLSLVNGTGSLTGAGLTAGATRELVLNAATAPIIVSARTHNNSGGASAVTIIGANTVTMSGSNDYTGGTFVNGTLKLGAANTIPSASSVTVNGTLDTASFSDTIAALSGAGVIDNSAAGTPTLTVNGTTSSTFTGTIKNTANALALTKTGSGMLVLASANAYSGGTTIGAGGGAGVIRAAANQALGTGNITFDSTGNSSTARLELAGGINLPNTISFSGRNNSTVGIENVSGSNSLVGPINMASGGGVYNIQTDAGLLTVGSGATAITDLASGARSLTFQGAGNGSVVGNITDGSGTVSITKADIGTWTLGGANTYSGSTTVNAGTLVLNGSLGSGSVSVNGGTLTGNGIIGGPVTVLSGGTLAPGGGLTILSVSNDVTLQNGSTTMIEISATALANDQLVASGTLTCSGTLVVTNISGTLAAGDTFQLFRAGTISGAFSSNSLPPLDSSLAWSNSLAVDGTITVVSTVSTVSTNILWNLSGTNLTLSWPPNHIGWRLQVQTNSLNGTNWVDVPGSSSTNYEQLPLDPTLQSIFYRLIYP
jgi:autotransporter-associated beta strand protein